jgi:uncharacterized protein YceH (UPF0502 family)
MPDHLNETETRVLGSLVEKQLTTPEYYPLTLNALTAACNQKTNRDPVTSYSDEQVTAAVDSLRDKNLVYLFYGSSSRVVKYKHMLPNVYGLEPPETAIVCVLMLRGPQTVGELRERTGRLFEFSGIGEVSETLDGLIARDEPIAAKLDRQPGQKEVRFAHLLSGEPANAIVHSAEPHGSSSGPKADRVSELEAEVRSMRSELDELKQQFERFMEQFD